METLVFTVVLMGFLMAIMAIGVMNGRPELKGSCGGVGGAGCQCTPGERESCEFHAEAAASAADGAGASEEGSGLKLPMIN